MTMLDPKGREAARLWAINATSDGGVPGDDYIDGILTAYLSTVTPAEVGGLVERLRDEDYRHEMQHLRSAGEIDRLFQEAATALEAQAAELAAVKENCETVCNSYADENQRLYDRAERAEAALAEAFRLGFFASSEGFNGEYPFEGEIPNDARGKKWLAMRDRILASLTIEPVSRRALTGGQEDG